MILAKVRVTARNEEDDAALREFTTYVVADTGEQVSPMAIQQVCGREPELDSSAVRFEVATLAAADILPGNRFAVDQRAALVTFLERNSSVPSEWLDDVVHELASAKASRVNNGGLPAQLDYLAEQLGTEGLLRELRALLHNEEED